jgi:hypothetical protein
MSDWPFDQPPNCAAFSLRKIVFGGAPILYVSHDEEDDGWQFLDGGPVEMSDAAVVTMAEVVELDPTVLDVADLPPGWRAMRGAVGTPWQREPNPRVSG